MVRRVLRNIGLLVLTDIVVRVSPRALRSITDLPLPKISPSAKPGILQRRSQPKKVQELSRSQLRSAVFKKLFRLLLGSLDLVR